MKKKLVTLLLGFALIFSMGAFSSCDDESGLENFNPDSIEDMTKEDWEDLSAEANFENVTVAIWGAYVSGNENVAILGNGVDIGVLKVVGENVYVDYIYLNDEDEFLDSDAATLAKSLYIETALAMLENFEDFTYDKESKTFLSNKPISYDIDAGHGATATLTTTNVKVEVLPDGYLGKISCDMKQYMSSEYLLGEDFNVDVKVVFSFSDYGTTVLPSTDNTNNE